MKFNVVFTGFVPEGTRAVLGSLLQGTDSTRVFGHDRIRPAGARNWVRSAGALIRWPAAARRAQPGGRRTSFEGRRRVAPQGSCQSHGGPVRAVVGRGPRAVEEQLLQSLLAHVEHAQREPARLARPVRVVVPSRSLAQHVCAALVRRAGGSVLGVQVQTLHGVACEITAASGGRLPPGRALLPVLVRRLARGEPLLRDALDALTDGYAAVEAALSDLLDAGFERGHADAVDEALAESLASGAARARARAVVRTAARVLALAEPLEARHRSSIFSDACDRLRRDPEAALPARAILLHGWADATGVQTDLIEALMRTRAAVAFLDRPLDPAQPGREDAGVAFGARFRSRLGVDEAAPDAPDPAPPRIRIWHAPGPRAEAAAVAAALRERLDAGAAPERMAVVARSLAPYRLALRAELRRLGVPFSGVAAAGAPRPARRRLEGLLALLREGQRLPAERWLELVDPAGRLWSAAQCADLRTAFHACGAARLHQVAALARGAEGGVDALRKLPVRRALAPAEAAVRAGPRHRRVDVQLWDEAIDKARGLLGRLPALSRPAAFGEQLRRLRGLVEWELSWSAGLEERRELAALEELSAGLPEVALESDELVLVLERAWSDRGLDPIGGAGAGVQLLDVMEARGRCFDQLFVIGLNRDLFPRAIIEDPLLPDALRERLRRDVLPDLPVKSDGYDEERFLFAQLVASSPEVTLSCAVTDDEGKARSPSPLIERLELSPGVPAPLGIASRHGRAALERAGPRPAREHALLAGLHGPREAFDRLLPLALAEQGDAATAEAAAAARLAVLDELDAASRQRAPGPYFGFVGSACDPADPRRAPPSVTTLERMAGCPWQAFLQRWLRLERPPDARDALPALLAPRLIGSLVHRVLERIVAGGTGPAQAPLEQVLARQPEAVDWPDTAAFDALLERAAQELVALPLAGFARVLALQARGHLEVARALEWPHGRSQPQLLGAEVDASLELSGRRVRFRADRLDRVGGELRWIDYKTGRLPLRQKTPAARASALLQELRRGTLLQAAAYARCGQQQGSTASEGLYLYLEPDEALTPDQRRPGVRADQAEPQRAFAETLGALLDAAEAGSFFPRLVEPDKDEEPRRCLSCEVKEACVRGDSGARARLAAWAESPAAADGAAEAALRRVWRLAGTAS